MAKDRREHKPLFRVSAIGDRTYASHASHFSGVCDRVSLISIIAAFCRALARALIKIWPGRKGSGGRRAFADEAGESQPKPSFLRRLRGQGNSGFAGTAAARPDRAREPGHHFGNPALF